ncbi:ABC transporter substrate-binding protein [Nitratireductor sp. StC3]|uniref:ABC transporter substrate-binding protein n=1 Tax=Nitratireductor sp. StC3 TaxID=2126741 RepID=UPI001304E6DF|nr:ABC transporter substrate-binding protein [Nitratireductor sp. StC3]
MKKAVIVAGALMIACRPGVAQEIKVPILAPLTGYISLEGTSQRNGAVLAVKNAPAPLQAAYESFDTATAPENAINVMERALSDGDVKAVVGPILGVQMLALLPLAKENEIPLITISGTAKVTEMDNPYVFRFMADDRVAGEVQARYAVEELGKKKPALLYQTNAYGQSGREVLQGALKNMGAPLVFEEGLEVSLKDMLPVLIKVRDSGADILITRVHGGPTALILKQARAMGLNIPIIASSTMAQQSTAALVEPSELQNVCAEATPAPLYDDREPIQKFRADYLNEFDQEPDAYALAQYDGVMMVLDAMKNGAQDAEAIRKALAGNTYQGLAGEYKSDGTGNMVNSGLIICYDGASRTPRQVKVYDHVLNR